jgi:hypothetical protein
MTDGAQLPEEKTGPAAPAGSGTVDLCSNGAFFQRTDWLSFAITTAVALAVYLITTAPELSVPSFGGILSTAAAYAGVPHPPGYPVWTIYSWCFVKLLPFSNIAWRMAVGSAVAAALACGLVALMVSRGGKMLMETSPTFARGKPAEQDLIRVVCGSVAGMALGLSGAVWRVAVLADTWALSILLFTTMLCLLLRWTIAPEQRRFLYGVFLVFSSLLTSNQEMVAVAPALLLWVLLGDQRFGRDLFLVIAIMAVIGWLANEFGVFPLLNSFASRNVPLLFAFLPAAVAAVVVILRTRHLGSEWKSATLCALFLLLGLGWFFYLPIASMTNPPSNWAYPRTVEGFFHAIARGQYERVNPAHDFSRLIGQFWMLTKETGSGFGWFYFGFTALPFCLLHRMSRSMRNGMLGLTAAFACVGPLMVAMLNPSADHQSVQLISPYFCVMYVVLAVLTGLGLIVAGAAVAKLPMRPQAERKPAS